MGVNESKYVDQCVGKEARAHVLMPMRGGVLIIQWWSLFRRVVVGEIK